MAWYNWSKTASSNATADPTINMAEGMAPSAVNDGIRALMARTAEWRDDISGAITTGGTSTGYTISSFQAFDTLAHMSGQLIGFVPNATNTNAVGVDITLNVDGLGAKPIRMQPSVAAPNGSFILGTPYLAVYNNSDGVFYVQNMLNPYVVPLSAGMDYWGSSTPNSSFAFPTGQAISRTTYATLFTLISTTYGIGDGSTTFNLPNKAGRISAMKEASATLLTTAGSGVDGGTLGATGGAQNQSVLQANLPNVNFTASNNITVVSTTNTVRTDGSNVLFGGGAISFVPQGATTNFITSTGANTISVPSGGSGTALKTTQPTIVCNYIMRIL